jgi:phosphoribosylformylglycinamidine synthase
MGLPVVGGNVSLYNSSDGVDIDPTPVIGVLGVIDELVRRPPGAGLHESGQLLQLGPPSTGALDGSRWVETAHGHRGGALPPLDVAAHAAVCELVRGLVDDALVLGIHDVSDGGLGLALAEMAVRSGTGFDVEIAGGHRGLFSESPSRVVACVAPEHLTEVTRRAAVGAVTVTPLGRAGGGRLRVSGLVDVFLADAVAGWAGALPAKLQMTDFG